MKWSIRPWFSHSTRVLFLKLRDNLTDRRARHVEWVIITSRLPNAQQQRAAKVWHKRETHSSHRCKNTKTDLFETSFQVGLMRFNHESERELGRRCGFHYPFTLPRENTQTVGMKRRQDKQIHAGTLTVGWRSWYDFCVIIMSGLLLATNLSAAGLLSDKNRYKT